MVAIVILLRHRGVFRTDCKEKVGASFWRKSSEGTQSERESRARARVFWWSVERIATRRTERHNNKDLDIAFRELCCCRLTNGQCINGNQSLCVVHVVSAHASKKTELSWK